MPECSSPRLNWGIPPPVIPECFPLEKYGNKRCRGLMCWLLDSQLKHLGMTNAHGDLQVSSALIGVLYRRAFRSHLSDCRRNYAPTQGNIIFVGAAGSGVVIKREGSEGTSSSCDSLASRMALLQEGNFYEVTLIPNLSLLYNLLFRFTYLFIHPVLTIGMCTEEDFRHYFGLPGIERHSYSLKMGIWRQQCGHCRQVYQI